MHVFRIAFHFNFYIFEIPEALEEVCEAISSSTNGLEKKVIDILTKEGCSQLENVKNIPRLYRRTNKEVFLK